MYALAGKSVESIHDRVVQGYNVANVLEFDRQKAGELSVLTNIEILHPRPVVRRWLYEKRVVADSLDSNVYSTQEITVVRREQRYLALRKSLQRQFGVDDLPRARTIIESGKLDRLNRRHILK